MIYPIAAIAVLWLLVSRADAFSRLFAAMRPRLPERAAAVLAVLAAVTVLLHGNVWPALCLFGLSLWLLGRSVHSSAADRASARISRVRSAMIEMDYDHATGRMTGRIIAGPHEGIALDTLDQPRCLTVLGLCRRDDPDGARLLEAYLDRRFSGWRPAGQGHGNAGESGERRARTASRMSEDEAYEVLGLRRGATRDEIVRSHRTVMKKWHPDQGGTSDLAALANEAKEVLLRRHA